MWLEPHMEVSETARVISPHTYAQKTTMCVRSLAECVTL